MTIEELENQRFSLQLQLDNDKTQTERNVMGQFSTPFSLACNIVEYVKSNFNLNSIRFLEPAVGTGVFISALNKYFSNKISSVLGLEIDNYYGYPTKQLWKDYPVNIEISDFFDYNFSGKLFNLIIANPPYSRHHHIPADVKKTLQSRVKNYCGINISGLSGLYTYFLILSTQYLVPNGISVWLIPSEFMDVNFGQAVREFLLNKVDLLQIHKFSSENVQFSDALITSSIVCFQNRHPSTNNVIFSTGNNINNPICKREIGRKDLENSSKWTSLFTELPEEYTGPTLGDYFTIKRGIATGNNNFFVLDKKEIDKYQIPDQFLTPILPSPRYINENIIESDNRGIPLLKEQYFLFDCNLNEETLKENYPNVWNYIITGVEKGVNKGYICSRRTPWYSTEKRIPPLFVVPYMGRENSNKSLFRFMLNNSNALATNVYLMLYPKNNIVKKLSEDIKVKYKIWDALNNISRHKISTKGREYGGGLHKIEPKELLQVPALEIDKLLHIHLDVQGVLFDCTEEI